MGENLTLIEFLKKLATCDGNEAIDLVSKFQSGGLTIENINVEDLDE